MSRAALLPTPGDPFVVSYWLRNATRVWLGEVDELHVLVNGGDMSVLESLFRETAGAPIKLTYTSHRVGHGRALRELLQECSADNVVLLEDDAYVTVPGALTEVFESLERGDTEVHGSPRGGMSSELEEAALARWGLVIGPDGSTGHGLWPCFLFSAHRTLLDVSDGFDARSWNAGERIPGLDYRCCAPMHTDTFTAAAFKLRHEHPITLVPQHKELWQKDKPYLPPPWFHAGGLSNLLTDGQFVNARFNIGGTNEGLDWAHRIWWWRRCAFTSGPELRHLRDRYLTNLDGLTRKLGVVTELAAWEEKLMPWIAWDDAA